jgi:uncharacterized protein YcbX
MHVSELWRYPVKSMAGERLDVVDVRADGLPGDRLVHVQNADGRVITSRTRPELLGLHGTLDGGGNALVNGCPWESNESRAAVRAAAGGDAELVAYDGLERFDVLPLSVATDGAIAAMGVDGRRFRPNIVIGGVPGLAERMWPGRRLRIGGATVDVARLRLRCEMTTYDPDTQEQDLDVLRRIVADFDGVLALDCNVVIAGRIAVGNSVVVVE